MLVVPDLDRSTPFVYPRKRRISGPSHKGIEGTSRRDLSDHKAFVRIFIFCSVFFLKIRRGEDHGGVEKALDRSLNKLGVEHADLFLVHWPQALLDNGTCNL